MVSSLLTLRPIRFLFFIGAVITLVSVAIVPNSAEAECGGYYEQNPYGVSGELFSSNPKHAELGAQLAGYWRTAYGGGADSVLVEQQDVCPGGDAGGGGGHIPFPTVGIVANPETIAAGSSTTLGWGSTDVSSCAIDQGIGSVAANENSTRVVTPAVTTTYTLTCDGVHSDSVTVTVTDAPDLVGQVGGAATTSVSQPVTLYGVVVNQGAEVAMYFPNLIQVCDAECATVSMVIAATEVESLAVGGSEQVSASYTPTSEVQQFYRVCANSNTDWVNVHTESNYGNNCSGWQYLTIGVSGSDLTAGSITPTSASKGVATSVSTWVSNIGGASAGASQVRFQSATDINGTGSSHIANAATAALGAGAGIAVSMSYTFPAEGTYYLRACADRANVVTESNEGNNCGAWTAIVVGPSVPPDSGTVSCNVSATSVMAGESVTYSTSVSGGVGAPYEWTASDGPADYGTGSTVTRSFDEEGPYDMSVTASGVSDPCPRVTVGANWCTGSTPILQIAAVPERVRAGQTSTVTWSATGVNGQDAECTVTGPGISWSSAVSAYPVCSASGFDTVTISTQSTYTLTCDGAQPKTVTVNVIPNFQEF